MTAVTDFLPELPSRAVTELMMSAIGSDNLPADTAV